MDRDAKYQNLRLLAEQMPDLTTGGQSRSFPVETYRWLGRLEALVEESGDELAAVELSLVVENLTSVLESTRRDAAHQITTTLFKALAQAEIRAPASASGSFIAVGNAFDAIRALSGIMASANTDALIIDPYMDVIALSDVAILASETVRIRLLSDPATVKPTLKPTVTAWQSQYQGIRPLEARLAAPRALHDRLIIIDRAKIWLLTQSLKDLAKRSPATLTSLDSQTANLKIPAYEDIWQMSSAI